MADDQIKDAALASFHRRKINPPVPIENSSLPAGSPMYFYCSACGHLADVKPEDWFLTGPRRFCSECEGLVDRGWLPEIKGESNTFVDRTWISRFNTDQLVAMVVYGLTELASREKMSIKDYCAFSFKRIEDTHTALGTWEGTPE